MAARFAYVLLEMHDGGETVLGVFSTDAKAEAAKALRPDLADSLSIEMHALNDTRTVIPEGFEVGPTYIVSVRLGRKKAVRERVLNRPRHPTDATPSFALQDDTVAMMSPVSFEHAEAAARRVLAERTPEKPPKRKRGGR